MVIFLNYFITMVHEEREFDTSSRKYSYVIKVPAQLFNSEVVGHDVDCMYVHTK